MRKIAMGAVLVFMMGGSQVWAQTGQPQRSKGKKIEWIGVAGVAGGITAIVAGVVHPGSSSMSVSTSAQVPCSSRLLSPDQSISCMVSGNGSVPITITTTEQKHVTNWKLLGPGIGAAGAGALLIEFGHIRVKRAEFSIRPSAIRVAFNW